MDEQAGPAVLFPGCGAVKPPLPGAGDAARALYSLPGALRFLQRQWASFERERHEWDAEKSELQSQIALLQGERRGQENLRKDLQRRIKMLEYSLRQERGRFHRLKHGSDLIQDQLRPPDYDSDEDEESPSAPHGPQSCAQGQQIISRFLEELGYSDVLEVRSNRVRVLLGLSPDQEPKTSQDSLEPLRCVESVMETFRIIERAAAQFNQDQDPVQDLVQDRDQDRDVDRDLDQDEDPTTADLMVRRHSTVSSSSSSSSSSLSEDADTEEALRGFDFLCSAEESAPFDLDLSLGRTWDQSVIEELKEQYKKERRGKKGVKRPNRSKLQDMLSNLREAEDLPSGAPSGPPRSGRFIEQETGRPDDESVFAASPGKSFLLGPVDEAVSLDLGLGELAGLTVADESEGPAYDVSVGSGDSVRRTWSQKFSLRSHLDSVRSVVFHPMEPLLLTASEDHTLKLWNLHKTNPNKKCAALDVEPIYTFRAHSAAVLSAVMSSSGEQFFSGGADGAIYSWNTPSAATDPYDPYEPGILRGALSGHSDAVWGVAYSSAHQRLISSSADGTLRVWDAAEVQPALTVIRTELGAPSSLDLVPSDPALLVCSFTSGPIALFNLETQQQVLSLETESGPGAGPGAGPEAGPGAGPQTGVNQVLSHPSLPLTISAGEDRHIRFYDNNTGKLVHSMVAHLDSVTCLCVDPNGLYLLSGSHDCSVRLWSLDSRTCVQEFTAHRRKFHESIHAVSFHRTLGYMCSGGADALAKVYV